MDFLNDSNKKKQFLYSYGAYIINGMLALSVGSLLPFIRDARGLEYAFCGLIVSLHSVGNLCSSFISGILPTIIGRKKSILFFNSFLALSFLLIIIGEHPLFVAAAFFLTGVARGGTTNFCNTSINELAPGKAAIINGMHAMFALGAFTFPLLLMLLTNQNSDNWIYAVYFMLIMGILNWLMYYNIPLQNDKIEKKEGNQSNALGFVHEPLFYICTATLFFYLCAEQGVIGWMITYFKDTGLLPPTLSQVTASLLWVMILVGRLLTAYLSTKVRKEWLMIVMGLGLVGFFFLLLFSTSTPYILIGIMGFGFSMAGIYPTIVSFAGNIINMYSLTWSFMLPIASIGSIIMPTIIGKIAETIGIYYGMSSIVVVVLIDLICIFGLAYYVNKNRA